MNTSVITEKDRFEAWLKELDEICFDELGLSYKDLADQPYKTWFENGFSPEDAYYKLTENEYPGAEFPNVFYCEIDEHSDADPGL